MILYLLDPQFITRKGFEYVAKQTDYFTKIVTVNNLKQLISLLCCDEENALVVIDYTLLDCTSDELMVTKQRFPKAAFLLFSDNLSTSFVRQMIFGNRSMHILMKNSGEDEVLEAFKTIARQQQFICSKVESWLYDEQVSEKPQKSPLTAVEKEILKSMSMGKSTKEIAAERFSSVYTVMTHRKNIFRKLEVNNAQEAIRYAVRAGIVNVMEYYI